MAELSTIARPYAEALFAAARAGKDGKGSGQAGPWTAAVDAIAGLVANPQAAESLANPALSDAQRYDLIAALAGQTLPAPVAQLLKVVIENNRLAVLPEVAAQFHALRNAAEGSADCIIESAFAMSPADVTGLVTALEKKFPFQLKPEVRLNPQLIGGVRVTVGDRVLDSSVRARLDAMQARLTA
jgi:F-type H+-transporting ATPase subunit delta